MSEKMLNILWIDDEHHKLPGLHLTAKDFGIKLFPYKSMNGGCAELEKNLSKYDAVLLDAKFFENEDDQPGSEDTQWIYDTKDRIRDLDRSLQYFVLTGQAKTYASEEFNKAFKNVFEKGKDKDEDTLFKMLVEACENREITQLKCNYSENFEVFKMGILDFKYQPLLIDILLNLKNEDFKKKNITVQRDLLEAIFKSLNNPVPCIPNNFFDSRINNKPNQEWCTLFFEGRQVIDQGVAYTIDKIIPKDISSAIRRIKESVNRYSHLSDDDVLKTPFLSNTFLLLELLEWIPIFVQEHYKNYI
jgi:hypothetical protein